MGKIDVLDALSTLQGTNISHLAKRKTIFKHAFLEGYVSLVLEGSFVIDCGENPECQYEFNSLNIV